MGSPRRRQVSEFPLASLEDESPPTPTVGVRRAREAMASAPLVREIDPSALGRDLGGAREERAPARRGREVVEHASPASPAEPYARGRELGALLYVAAATFITLAIASYDDRGGADWVGPVGARVASIFVSAVGLAAWAVPVELGLFAIPYLRRRASVITPARIAGDVVLLATAAALIHVGASGRTVFGGHLAGGVIGELFGELLRSLFSTVGTFLVGFTTIALVLIARATFSFIAFANRAGATSAAAANKAAASVKGVAEAWQQAKELDRGELAPALVSSGSHDPESGGRITLTGDRPSVEIGSALHYADKSGMRAVAELRMRDDGAISPETHLIARQLAGVDLGADAMPGGPSQMPKSPPREPAVSTMAKLHDGGIRDRAADHSRVDHRCPEGCRRRRQAEEASRDEGQGEGEGEGTDDRTAFPRGGDAACLRCHRHRHRRRHRH